MRWRHAVALMPGYTRGTAVPGVVFRPMTDSAAHWDLVVAWQRGRVPEPVRVMLEALPAGIR